MEHIEASNVSCGDLGVDEACLLLKSHLQNPVIFQYQSLECENCNLNESKNFHHDLKKLTLDFVSFGTKWRVVNEDNAPICRQEDTFFEEKAWYSLIVNESGCSVTTDRSAPSPYIPLMVAVAVYVLLGTLWMIFSFLYRKKVWKKLLSSQSSMDELAAAYSSSSCIEDQKLKPKRQRLRSLDTVRGIAIVLMIFVNYGGGKYWFFDHMLWNGLTVADLVFPWFIWMMGMSMALSMRSLLRKMVPRRKIFAKIVKRSIILFALGLMLNTHCLLVDLKDIRISGVLQRFSISYFVVATIHLIFAQAEDSYQESSFAPFRDILVYWVEWIIMIALLVTHILLTFFVHAPGCPAGYLGPGGLHDEGKYSLCTGGAAGYIDRIVLGEDHLYQRPTFKAIYKSSLPYDPEGILGYLTSIFLVYLGLQAGKILLTFQNSKSRIIRWLIWALVTGLLAMLLSKLSKDDGWIPVNKNLWSVSFIFATGSLAFLLIVFCYVVIDVKKWWTGAPFFCAGMNSILLYVGHSITHNMFPWSWKVPSTHAAELAIQLWGTTLWVIIAAWAFHFECFITV